ncbi:hypothetical protein VF21_06409 [Pseudogymnoascus sp. 05NY08]|nr:hypothetical protein VF21_06409 [Pseudogymnoascus sp. 05NY08]
MEFIILLLLCLPVVVGNWLYLHGGEIHYNDNGVMTYLPKIYHDTKHNVVYSYGGAYYSANFKDDHVTNEANVTPEVWGFTPPENGNVNWSRQFAKSISDSFPLTSSVEYALTTSSDKKHYSFGGTITYNVVADGGEGVPIQMVMEDFVTYDYATQTYSNVSRTAPHSLAGEAQFVPQYGEEGVLLFFGGKNPLDRGVASLDLADLGSIEVYDIYTDTFYTQAATNAPTGRYSFCSVGASNANGSSYEIFIYGGDVGSSNSAAVATLSKVYILTLPAFLWLEVPTSASTWRNNHKCQKIGEKSISQHNQRQMISVGGDQHPSGIDWSSYVDSWNSAMKIFDLTALTWSDSYNPDAKAYTRPDMVDRFYSGNSAFPSTWGDAALNSIFNKSVTATTPKTTSTPTPTPTSTPTPTPTPKKDTGSKTHIGDIAGGVVGGVFAAALAGFLLWWFCWRKRKADNKSEGVAATDYQGNQGYQNVKEVGGDGSSEREEVELSVGKDIPRRELPADDTPRQELDTIEYQHKYRMTEPQKLSNGTR